MSGLTTIDRVYAALERAGAAGIRSFDEEEIVAIKQLQAQGYWITVDRISDWRGNVYRLAPGIPDYRGENRILLSDYKCKT